MEPHERLALWLKSAQISQAELARRVDYDRSNIHRILNGRLRPSKKVADNIAAVTAGAIPAVVWEQAA